ncbi:MAG: polyribonucleotide nucleotidyltransferase [Deltaproteobacteria bacterium CG2_30_63_29]|nr:MAG: polyribonucleotide nucleotidyltransferase [Deltaproteobacteria bacterium CG2_30_63_29]PJB49305.1 MAG: polyribonucleotide nucleotidyltransferase [Deltaproteobacteria bacterium CG_4_9_14_3_um_filter_63_12]
MSRIIRESVLLGKKEITIETGRIAKQAGGAVLIQSGDSIVLVTATGGPAKTLPFFPMTCDYVEKSYAAGRIPGSYFRREARQGEKEILTSRLIDRPCRPLFPEGFRQEVQIIATVLSYDQENDTDVLAITGASAALMLSDLPWAGPVVGLRLGRIEEEWIANPTFSQRALSDVDIVMVASADAIVMVEGEANELSEEEFLAGMAFGRNAVKEGLALQRRLAEAVGKTKQDFVEPKVDEVILAKVTEAFGDRVLAALQVREKLERYAGLDAMKDEVKAHFAEQYPERESELSEAYSELKSRTLRQLVARKKVRIDGRRLDEIRPISCEVGILPRVHGSALFTRGETQAIVTMTVGTSGDDQRIEELFGMRNKRFMLHYNFPPFSVGEARPLRGPGRREIGHGMLAERALANVLPTSDEGYPYVLRIVSEITESNGSSSMASVCGGTLAAMDAGLPITKPVAGIAMGLIKEGDDISVLSDILGDEDHLGDMDFKVCGTKDGITAIQMDVKIAGISDAVMKVALEQARQGRIHILGKMAETLSEPRSSMSAYAPRIVTLQVNPSKIRDIIGQGGKTIRGIIAQTGVSINVEDDGTVNVASGDAESLEKALSIVKGLTREPAAGEVYLGTVRSIRDFGAFIEIFPGTDGMCHISELTEGRVESVNEVLALGDEVLVKVLQVDRQGKIRLSRRAALGEEPTTF